MQKIIFILFIAVLSSTNLSAQQKPKPEDQIKRFWFVMLSKGTNLTHDSATAAKIQKEHIANIYRLYYDGKLKVSGPFGDKGNWSGLFIFDCETKEEVENLLKTDPAIASGRLAYDLRPWYSAPIGSFAPGKPKKE